MPVIREGRFVADAWLRPAPADVLPEGADVILPFDRLDAEGGELAAAGHRLGVEIPNTAAAETLLAWLPRLKLIVVAFPKSADGRGFSIATRLRRLGYAGELRASGHVIADQYALAKACGFDTVEIAAAQAERQPEAHWMAADRAMSIAYQQGHDGRRSILEARWGR